MKNKPSPKPIPHKKQVQNILNPSYYVLFMAYIIVPVIVPNFNTFDSNGPKFLALGILNLIAFIVLVYTPDYLKRPEVQTRFFRSFIGIAYTLFLCISLLSFINAINLTESVLNFIKTFTVFVSAYVLFVIFSSSRGYLLHLVIAFTILLLFDSLTVFYNMILYISREVTSIMDIKSLYSHKNVLASALFVKLPFALYLIFYSGGWHKRLGYVACLSAIFALLLLSTRAFYIGLAFLLVTLLLYVLVRNMVISRKGYLLTITRWVGLFVLALILYSVAQRFLFPKNTDTIWNTGIISRLSSIRSDESSTNARLRTWDKSVKLIQEHPLLGVGTGNWKIVVLKYENMQSPDFIYPYKSHNDFLEITAEIGLPGGLLYITIFILIIVGLIKVSLKSVTDDDELKLLFLPAFGILAYSVDAFFNFPADRPEIQSLFAIFVAMGAAYSKMGIQTNPASDTSHLSLFFRRYYINKLIGGIVCFLLLFSCWILFLNAESLYYQRRFHEDKKSGNLFHLASFFIEGFPFIPTVSSFGEPIAVLKAQCLIREKRYKEAIGLLLPDESSPYDSQREYYIASAYEKSGMMDSAIIWGQKAYLLKPFNKDLIIPLCSWLFSKGRHNESLEIISNYLKQVKTNPAAWDLAAYQFWADGQNAKSVTILDSAIKYVPGDTTIISHRKLVARNIKIAPFEELYNQIILSVNTGQYDEAIKSLNEFINKKPGFSEAYMYRAFCFHMKGQFAKSINDINIYFKFSGIDYSLLNKRGENFLKLGDLKAACRDFKEAMDKGNADATENYQKFCAGSENRK